jgi:hypothetical protein
MFPQFFIAALCSEEVRRATEDGAGWKIRKEIRETKNKRWRAQDEQ